MRVRFLDHPCREEVPFARQRDGDHAGLHDLFAERVDLFAPGAASIDAMCPTCSRSEVSQFFAALDQVLVKNRDFVVLSQDAVVTGFAHKAMSANPMTPALHRGRSENRPPVLHRGQRTVLNAANPDRRLLTFTVGF
ncbi:hypothetical protein J7E88_22265 [Streptomyces sp. ISL-10]|uniref:hypothetical protein n=1 Tax=Streptomyces sp. ISL-10 TaxID=2819172 RepID=UPI001BE6935A|nr:hypothetical protein [Streptomyces sp. ISL-10]MBT2367962.1 hypothetical protein [Streptomyces sp. ISL-10]